MVSEGGEMESVKCSFFCFCLDFSVLIVPAASRGTLNDGRLTTADAVDANCVVVRCGYRHWPDVDFVWLHEGVLQSGRLRRVERFRADERAFQPTSKTVFEGLKRVNWVFCVVFKWEVWGNCRSVTSDSHLQRVTQIYRPGAWADWAASWSAIRLIVHVVHDGRCHLLDGGLNLGRGDWVLELLLSVCLLLRHHRRCQSTREEEENEVEPCHLLRMSLAYLSCGVLGWLSFSWLLQPR